jgi:hypothetical protein
MSRRHPVEGAPGLASETWETKSSMAMRVSGRALRSGPGTWVTNPMGAPSARLKTIFGTGATRLFLTKTDSRAQGTSGIRLFLF